MEAFYKEKRGKKIDQYTLAGKKVALFLSIMDASTYKTNWYFQFVDFKGGQWDS
jgi:hypothetical protein